MTMNDWDGLSGSHNDAAAPDSAPQHDKRDDAKNVVNLPGSSAKSNNKTMYLVMGGLMLFVMGVFGYTKYMQMQSMQNEERMQQEQALKQKKEDAERKKREAEAAEKEKTIQAAAAEKNATEQASSTEPRTDNPDLQDLARLKGGARATGASSAVVTTAPQRMATGDGNAIAQKAVVPALPPAQNYANPQDMQRRDQYVSMLEGRINELSLTKLRLEAELCKHEPKRQFCNQSGKSTPITDPAKESIQQIVRAPQPMPGDTGRVMLFESGKAAGAQGVLRPVSSSNSIQTPALATREQVVEPAPRMSTLQGLTILRDRVVYRDRDGLTHEVELGGEMEGLGRLEKIDFEKKSFQVGGRTYN